MSLFIIEPSQYHKFYCHFPVDGLDSVDARFRCISCRKAKPINEFGATKMKRRGQQILMAICFRCRGAEKQTNFAAHPLYTPELDVFFSKLYASTKGGANARKLPFLVYKEDFLGRYLNNDGRCEASGVVLKPFSPKGAGKNFLARSIDRIDSTKGYTTDNIQIVAHIVNIMKTELSMDAFVIWCQRIAAYRDLKTEKLAEEFEMLE